MPNLAGTFDMRDEPSCDSGTIARLSNVLDVPGVEYTARSWSDERFAAVNLLTGICGNLEQPAVTADQVVLFLDGEIYNLPELWDELTDRQDLPNPARACLELYRHYGDEVVKRLNGQFNILIYDKAGSTVRILNDRLGYRPFYYWCDDGLAICGLEKKAIFAILGKAPGFDAMGTLEFLTFGHNLDDRTVFSGVRVMLPGSILQFKDGRVTSRQYWSPSYVTARAGSLNESAHEFGRRLSAAVERRAKGPRRFGIFLSGGLDSRAAAGPLARVCDKVASFTFGDWDSADLEYGRELATKLGFTFHRLRYDDLSFVDLLPRVVWRTEGSLPFHQVLSIVHHKSIRAEADVLFNGHFGDVLTGGHLLPGQVMARGWRALANHILAKRTMLRLPMLERLLNRSFLAEAYPEMVSGVEKALRAIGEDRQPLAYNLWDMRIRQARFTFSSPAVERYVLEPVTPFTDNDVVDWMLRMPLRYLFSQRVYKRMMVLTFPEIAFVPWARTGRPIPTSLAKDLTVQAWLFAKKRLPGRPGPTSDKTNDNEGLRGLVAYVEDDLTLDRLPDNVFNRDAIRQVARAAVDGSGATRPLFLISTLAACGRLFSADGVTETPSEARLTP